MRRFFFVTAVAAVCLALALPQQQPRVRVIANLASGEFFKTVLSPNGRFLAISGRDSLLVMDVASGRSWTVLRRQSKRSYEFDDIDWSPKGDLLAFNRGDDDQKTDFIWTLPIDESTGRATGEARRVSITGGDLVAVSPNGESIAFADYATGNNGPQRVVLVPTRGGRERILADPKANLGSMAWSDDGQWVYYEASRPDTGGTIERVSLSGGAPQVVRPPPARSYVMKPGPLIVRSDPDRVVRIIYATGDRMRASFQAPLGGPGLDAANASATLFYGLQTIPRNRLVAVSLANGSTRLLDTSQQLHAIATPAPGNRIVFFRVVDGVRHIVAINADGGGRREYVLQHAPQGVGSLSPDGRRLAFPSVDSVQRLVLLDLQSGTERVLASGAGILSQNPRWRSDGRLSYVQFDQASRTRTVHEVTADGIDRVVRSFANAPPLGLLNDTIALLAPRGRLELVPLPRGEPRVIFNGPHAGATLSPDDRFLAVKTTKRAISSHPDSVAVAITDPDAIAIVDLRSGQRRDIALDFRMQTAVSSAGSRVHALWWHPDGRNLIVNMSKPGDGIEDVYLVPINGDQPRLIQRGLTSDTRMVPLSDGNTVVVSLRSPTATNVLEVTPPAASQGGPPPRTK